MVSPIEGGREDEKEEKVRNFGLTREALAPFGFIAGERKTSCLILYRSIFVEAGYAHNLYAPFNLTTNYY